jgi:hypothetical protein
MFSIAARFSSKLMPFLRFAAICVVCCPSRTGQNYAKVWSIPI